MKEEKNEIHVEECLVCSAQLMIVIIAVSG